MSELANRRVIAPPRRTQYDIRWPHFRIVWRGFGLGTGNRFGLPWRYQRWTWPILREPAPWSHRWTRAYIGHAAAFGPIVINWRRWIEEEEQQ